MSNHTERRGLGQQHGNGSRAPLESTTGANQPRHAPADTLDIVFDLGAVVFTWEPELLVRTHLAEHVADDAAAAALAQALFHHEDWLGFDRGTHSLDDALARMAARLALPLARLAAMMPIDALHLKPIDVSIALLDALRRERDEAGAPLRLLFLSNMPAPHARILMAQQPCMQWFDGGIFSGDVKVIKPQREIFDLLATRFALQPTRTLFIDDSAANVQAARALGWSTLHCTDPAELPAQLAKARAVLMRAPPQMRTPS